MQDLFPFTCLKYGNKYAKRTCVHSYSANYELGDTATQCSGFICKLGLHLFHFGVPWKFSCRAISTSMTSVIGGTDCSSPEHDEDDDASSHHINGGKGTTFAWGDSLNFAPAKLTLSDCCCRRKCRANLLSVFLFGVTSRENGCFWEMLLIDDVSSDGNCDWNILLDAGALEEKHGVAAMEAGTSTRFDKEDVTSLEFFAIDVSTAGKEAHGSDFDHCFELRFFFSKLPLCTHNRPSCLSDWWWECLDVWWLILRMALVATGVVGALTEPFGKNKASGTDGTACIILDDTGWMIPDDNGRITPDNIGCIIPDDIGCMIPDNTGCIIPDDTGCITPDDIGCMIPDDIGCMIPDGTGCMISFIVMAEVWMNMQSYLI